VGSPSSREAHLAASSFENQCPDSTAVFADGDCAFADEPPQPAAAITSTHNREWLTWLSFAPGFSQTNHAEGYVPPSPGRCSTRARCISCALGPAAIALERSRFRNTAFLLGRVQPS